MATPTRNSKGQFISKNRPSAGSVSSRANRPRSRQLKIPIWPRRRVVIGLETTSREPSDAKKDKKNNQASSQANFNKRLITTFALMLIGLAGMVYFVQSVINTPSVDVVYSPPSPSIPRPKPKITADTLPKSEPKKVTIASIGVAADMMSLGRKADGAMEVPPLAQAHLAGWYNLGPSPGEIGPAVLVGHVDTKDGPAIFWRLRELQPGQTIDVKRADNKVVKFKVDSVKQFAQDNFPTAEVYGNTDHPALRLITCGGSYNRLNDRYSHNTVVFASIVKDEPAKAG